MSPTPVARGVLMGKNGLLSGLAGFSKKEGDSLLPLVSTAWLTNPENPHKVLERRRILHFFATNTITKVLVH